MDELASALSPSGGGEGDAPNPTFAVDSETLSSLGIGEEDALTPLDGVDDAEVLARAAALNARYRDAPPAEVLTAALAAFPGRIALVSSFGAESAVLLHLVAQVDPTTPVIFTDTGHLFPETLAYRDLLAERLALTDLRTTGPDPLLLTARDAGNKRWTYDPDGCCELRKVEPLQRALAPFEGWISGRKGFQAVTRAALPRFEDESGRLKINPLADWSKLDLDHYFAAHALPCHPLEAQGYPSIGCTPCTTPVRPGEDARAGRWRGFDKVECGIHAAPSHHEPGGA